jgi:hypothetical protein
VAYRKLEIDDKVKIINPGFNNHGSFGVVTDLIGDTALVHYTLWESHRQHETNCVFPFSKLLLSTGKPTYTPEDEREIWGEVNHDDVELYKGNLLERILKLEQEVLDLKKRLA